LQHDADEAWNLISPTAASLPKIRAAKTAFCVMAVSGPRVTFCSANRSQAKQLVPNRPCWALEAAQASPSGAQVLLYRRKDGSRVAIDLRGFDNVEHAPPRGPCFQLKIAGRLLLDVTSTAIVPRRRGHRHA